MKPPKKNPRSTVACTLRDEGSGIKSYYPLNNSGGRQVHFMNKTAAQIFELCDGKNDCGEITRILGKFYPRVDYTTLLQDVKDCLTVLKSHEFIEWEEDRNSGDSLMKVGVADESDFKEISSFIIECLGNDSIQLRASYLPVQLKQYYSPFLIRTRQFHGGEICFVVKKDDCLLAVASILPSNPPLKSAKLGCFAVKEASPAGADEGLLYCMADTMKRLDLVKLRCDLISTGNCRGFEDFLIKHRFRLEATLAGEAENNGDVLIFSLFF